MNEIQNTNVRVGHREKALLSSLWDLAVSWGCDGWDHRVGRPDTLRPNCWERPIAPWAAADWSWQNSTRAKPSRAVSCCWWPWKKKNGKEHVNGKFHSTHTLPVITNQHKWNPETNNQTKNGLFLFFLQEKMVGHEAHPGRRKRESCGRVFQWHQKISFHIFNILIQGTYSKWTGLCVLSGKWWWW